MNSKKKHLKIRKPLLLSITISKFVVLGLIIIQPLHGQNLDSLLTNSIQFAQLQLANSVSEITDPSKFPRYTKADGSWQTKDSSSWTSGFFPGCLWYMYEITSANSFKIWAENWTWEMEDEKNNSSTHDVGFKIFNSFGNGSNLTGNTTYKDVIIQAASTLSTRFNYTVGCTRSWDNRTFPVIIDNMMNLELLFWASKNGGESEWYDMAVSHALKTIDNHVRSDGSTYQIVDYDPSTGEVIKKETHQGSSTESTWARGQAWGVYGFTMTFRETGDPRFLATAQNLADYFIDNLPSDHVPYWDFDAPNIPNEEKDASAAAIAACGLLELSTFVNNDTAQVRYYNAASEILVSLSSPAYLAEHTNSSGILLHGVGNRPGNKEVDVSLIYSDYYFLEAIKRYQTINIPVPVELSFFNAFIKDNKVVLTWRTESEINSFGFEVQRRFINQNFEKIGFVKGNENSAEPANYTFKDDNPGIGVIFYRLKQIDRDGSFEFSPIVDIEMMAPTKFVLKQNFPNPFNHKTKITYILPLNNSNFSQPSRLNLTIHDIQGRKVRTLLNEEKLPGIYSIAWDGKNQNGTTVGSGTYLYKLTYGNQSQTKKLLFLK